MLIIRINSLVMGVYDLGDGAAAFTYSDGEVVIEGVPLIQTLLHEFTHSMDWNAFTSLTDQQFSTTSLWQNSYEQDSASVTEYSRTNWAENFAEYAHPSVYDTLVSGGFGNIEPNWSQVQNALHNYEYYVADLMRPASQCTFRLQDSPTTSATGASKARRASKKSINDAELYPNIDIIEPNPVNAGKCSKDYHIQRH